MVLFKGKKRQKSQDKRAKRDCVAERPSLRVYKSVWKFEQDLVNKGITLIAGVDEAGRGPLAGPVVAAAVIIPPHYRFKTKIADSKKLSPKMRDAAFDEITGNCLYRYFLIGEKRIDKDNILNATLLAMKEAVERLIPKPEWVLIDGPHKPGISFPCTTIIDGDNLSVSIACASIVAKVVRDRRMREYDSLYPEYGFAGHKGYGTRAHLEAIVKHGPCPIHRKSFYPIKRLLKNAD
ncbi:MAG: ribonuclease HII [Candidatus Omnitrophica bacterium]|nr:ribonuclease HII [Candidatus Omnitrophota bacterium]